MNFFGVVVRYGCRGSFKGRGWGVGEGLCKDRGDGALLFGIVVLEAWFKSKCRCDAELLLKMMTKI